VQLHHCQSIHLAVIEQLLPRPLYRIPGYLPFCHSGDPSETHNASLGRPAQYASQFGNGLAVLAAA
jgi:hypothetical protein